MNDPLLDNEDWYDEAGDGGSSIALAVVLMIALLLLLAAFVWFVILLDPFMTDFIGGDVVGPTATSLPDVD